MRNLIEPLRITEWGPAGLTKNLHVPREQISKAGICIDRSRWSSPAVRAGERRWQPPRGGMGTQFGFWTSRAWGFLADALASLGDEPTDLEALPMPGDREPLLSWSVYLANKPAKWLGTVEASSAAGAIE